MHSTLLQTKLFAPTTRPKLVKRPSLIQKLNEGSAHKLTLISAPAGFGKTTLVTAWIQQTEQSIAWLSLDDNDNEIVRFLTYLVAAVQTLNNEVGQTAVSALQAPQPPPIEAVLTSLINDVAQTGNRFTLVLDDYHLIKEKAIHDGVSFLLDHMPPNFHIIMTTRANPPLPLARWRARGQMQEIRVQSLRFSVDEVAALFEEQLPHNLSQKDVQALAERTEGWVTGLQLAAVSLQDSTDPAQFIESFAGSNQYILDYLLEEVLQQQPTHIQTFLMETAVLTQLSGPLCDAVLEQTNSQEILEHLQAINLFVIGLDQTRLWFRYHHLFADLLLHRLQRTRPEQTAVLHQRASIWYEAHDFITEALYHARMMGDYERAIELVSKHATRKAYQGESNTVFAWVNSLPPELIQTTPYLSIVKAWQALYLMQLPDIDRYLDDVEGMLPYEEDEAAAQALHGEILPLRAWAKYYQGESQQTIALSRQALNLLPADNDHVRSLVLGPLAVALLDEGETEDAIAVSLDALAAYNKVGNWLASLGVVQELADIYMMCGRLHQAESCLQVAFKNHPPNLPATGQLYCGLGMVAYEKDELETAEAYFQQALHISQRKTVHLSAHRNLAKIYMAMGMLEQAKTAIQKAESIIQQWIPSVIKTQLPVLKVQFALLFGDVTAATRWQQQYHLHPPAEFTYQNELPALTVARLLIAQGRTAGDADKLTAAEQVLTQIEARAATAKRHARVMEAQILRALVYDAAEQNQQATTTLMKAITLAEAEGYRRVLLDEGLPMAQLLQKLPQTPFVAALLSGFPETAVPRVNQDALIEPLSERELEVLRLAAQRYSYREIADELIVSLNTIRFHMKNIYTKLGVNKKAQAIGRAEELHLL